MTHGTTIGLACAAAAAAASIVLWQALRRFSRRRVAALVGLARDDLADLFLFVEPERLARAMAYVLLLAAGIGLWRGWGAFMVVGLLVAWAVAPRALLGILRRRRLQRVEREMPDAVAALAAQLRAGQGVAQGLASIASERGGALAQELSLVLRRHRLGIPLDAALAELEQRVPVAEIGLWVGALRVARELGGALADALDRLAESLRRRQVMEDRIRALTAQGRMQGVIVSLLPPAVAGALAVIEPDATSALLTQPTGWAVLAVVVALQASGWIMIRRIVDIDV